MNKQTITIDQAQAELLVTELAHLEKIRKLLLKVIPESYLKKGSDLWWAKSDLEALEDVKKGNYKQIKSHEELDKFLNTL
jgi:hypothetical protein